MSVVDEMTKARGLRALSELEREAGDEGVLRELGA